MTFRGGRLDGGSVTYLDDPSIQTVGFYSGLTHNVAVYRRTENGDYEYEDDIVLRGLKPDDSFAEVFEKAGITFTIYVG